MELEFQIIQEISCCAQLQLVVVGSVRPLPFGSLFSNFFWKEVIYLKYDCKIKHPLNKRRTWMFSSFLLGNEKKQFVTHSHQLSTEQWLIVLKTVNIKLRKNKRKHNLKACARVRIFVIYCLYMSLHIYYINCCMKSSPSGQCVALIR